MCFVSDVLPSASEVGVTSVGVAYTGVGGMTAATLCVLQLSPVQHSILQSSTVTFCCASAAAFKSAQAAALSAVKK